MEMLTLEYAKRYTDSHQCLPEGGAVLPVVELATTLKETDKQMSDEDCAKLTDASNKGYPIIVKAKVACVNELVEGGYEYYNISLIVNRVAPLESDGDTEIAQSRRFYYVGMLDNAFNMEMRFINPFGSYWYGYANMTKIST